MIHKHVSRCTDAVLQVRGQKIHRDIKAGQTFKMVKISGVHTKVKNCTAVAFTMNNWSLLDAFTVIFTATNVINMSGFGVSHLKGKDSIVIALK